MLKSTLLVSAVALCVFAPISAQAAPPQETAPATASKIPVKPTAQSQDKAKKLYAMDCALCHGATGDGKTDLAKDMQLSVVDWTDPKTLSNRMDQELFNVIRHGKDKMPAEDAGRAKDDEVWNLVILIRSFAKSQPVSTAPAATPAPGN